MAVICARMYCACHIRIIMIVRVLPGTQRRSRGKELGFDKMDFSPGIAKCSLGQNMGICLNVWCNELSQKMDDG